jgi:PKHD-type hydroxylase
MFHNFEPANENTNWIFMRLNWVVEQLNNQFYNFDLNGFDSIQYTEYDDTEGGKYDFHQDTIFGLNKPGNMVETRKLSLVLLLAEPGVDFEGGDFQVNQGQECDASTVEFKKGRVIAFPSWQIHRVTPTTKGKRKSLVLWVTGPKFK